MSNSRWTFQRVFIVFVLRSHNRGNCSCHSPLLSRLFLKWRGLRLSKNSKQREMGAKRENRESGGSRIRKIDFVHCFMKRFCERISPNNSLLVIFPFVCYFILITIISASISLYFRKVLCLFKAPTALYGNLINVQWYIYSTANDAVRAPVLLIVCTCILRVDY